MNKLKLTKLSFIYVKKNIHIYIFYFIFKISDLEIMKEFIYQCKMNYTIFVKIKLTHEK